MNNINKLDVSENGKKWRKVCSRDYVVIADGETLFGTATLFTTGEHGWLKYVDVEHGIESEKHWDRITAKRLFEDHVEKHIGKIYWAR